jgi:uncharacterized membrane protein YccC
MAYNQQQFNTAYHAVVQMLHGLKFIDTEEISRWINELTAADRQKPEGQEAIDRLQRIMAAVHNLRETLKREGIPPLPQRGGPLRNRGQGASPPPP